MSLGIKRVPNDLQFDGGCAAWLDERYFDLVAFTHPVTGEPRYAFHPDRVSALLPNDHGNGGHDDNDDEVNGGTRSGPPSASVAWPARGKPGVRCIHCVGRLQDVTPVPIPLRKSTEGVYVLDAGLACSWSCAKAVLLDKPRYNYAMTLALLHEIARLYFGWPADEPILVAPPRTALRSFGGELAREAFDEAKQCVAEHRARQCPFALQDRVLDRVPNPRCASAAIATKEEQRTGSDNGVRGGSPAPVVAAFDLFVKQQQANPHPASSNDADDDVEMVPATVTVASTTHKRDEQKEEERQQPAQAHHRTKKKKKKGGKRRSPTPSAVPREQQQHKRSRSQSRAQQQRGKQKMEHYFARA